MDSNELIFYQRIISGIWAALAFSAGASIGSFLNVVAWRVPMGESIVYPGSHCPRCDHPLAWYDNIPLLSYLLLGARCRYCREHISAQYPLVEALGGFLGLSLWLLQGPGIGLFIDAIIVSLLLALALIDAQHFILPLKMNVALGLIAILRAPLVTRFDLQQSWLDAAYATLPRLYGALMGAVLLGVVAWLGTMIARRSGRIAPDQDAMGGGDIILIAAIGARLGVYPVLAVIFLASIQGAIIGGILLWVQSLKKDGSDENDAEQMDEHAEDSAEDEDMDIPAYAIPFGPFLALAAVEWILFGARLEMLINAGMDKILPF